MVGESNAKVPYLQLADENAVEIDPEELFALFVNVVKKLLVELDIQPNEIITSGFTFQVVVSLV